MLISSGQILLEAGMRISGVASDEAGALRWARSLEIPTIGYGPELVAWLEQSPVEYLFSIFNLRILPAEALRLPLIAAMNFHDGPLPRYAGLHATSWALFNGEKTHGVTWHLMEPKIDTGAIVKQRWIEVAEGETALSLNLKCFVAGLAALTELVPDLVRGTIQATLQDSAQRTYCAGSSRPPAGGILNWGRSGEESEAMARGTDFGPYFNPLVLPKVWTGAECVIAREVRLGDMAHAAPPGTVLAIDDTSLTIATASRPVIVGGLATIDGESLSVPEAASRYGLHLGQVLPELPPECVQQLTSSSEKLARHEGFWAKRLQSLCPVSPVRALGAARAVEDRAVVSQVWHVPEGVVGWIDREGQRWQLEEFLLAAFGSFLARMDVHDSFDIEFRDGGSRPSDPFGMFAEHVPFHFDIEDDFEVVLQRVREERTRIARRQTYARDLIPRSPALQGQAPLCRRGKLPVAVELGAVGDAADSGYELFIRFPLQGLEGLAVFEADFHDSVSVILDRFSAFLENLVTRGTMSLREIPLVRAEERETILQKWSSTGPADPSTDCLHHLFESQVAKTPNAVAVQCGSVEMTYRELDAEAERLAERLRQLGVGPESLVGVCLERSAESIIGLLGILKAGGGYVPLDPAYPLSRLAFIVKDSGIQAVVSLQKLADKLPTDPWLHRVYLDANEPPHAADSPTGHAVVRHHNLAYIIYTSGSAGEPKGVMVEHRAVVNFVRATLARCGLRCGDRVLQFASLNFDASVEEIFSCLAIGGTLVLRSEEMLASARVFMEQCAAWRISVLDLPTAFWHMLVTQMKEGGLLLYPDLRVVIIGGEAASGSLVMAWREMAGPNIPLFNGYGPTEATVVSTLADLGEKEVSDVVPIGVPIAGATAYVLDRCGQPLPLGFIGHLHIGGAGLARGYLNRPELTAERFVPDPFSGEPGARMYRTGDQVRWLADGSLEYLGRLDGQVKVRGFRIELGEIEAALERLPEADIRQAVVIVREMSPGNPALVAYLVGGEERDDDTIRQGLERSLPPYMIPAAYMRLGSFPLTPNGKVDRNALPQPEFMRHASTLYVAPRTRTEEELAKMWQELLGPSQVGIHDNFFQSGGHSLLAVRLLSRIHDCFGVDLSLASIFQSPTIAGLESEIQKASRDVTQPVLELLREGFSGLPPLVVMPGIYGDYYAGWQQAAEVFPEDRSIYAMRVAGPDPFWQKCETFEDLARGLGSVLKEAPLSGPCHLAGWSMGGLLAYELALQLSAQGFPVGSVLIFDTGPDLLRMSEQTTTVPGRLRNLLSMARNLPAWLKDYPNMPKKPQFWRNIAVKVRARVSRIRKWANGEVTTPADQALPEWLELADIPSLYRERGVICCRMLDAYHPGLYDGRVTLFRCRTERFIHRVLGKFLGWEQCVQKPIRLVSIPGFHTAFLSTRYIDDHLAEIVSELRGSDEACRPIVE